MTKHASRQGTKGRALRPAAAVILLGLAVGWSTPASAVDHYRRWSFGFRAGQFIHADREGGGFRFDSAIFGERKEAHAKVNNHVVPTLTLGYGLKRWEGAKAWQNAQLTLELEVSRWTSEVGREIAWVDPNASTRYPLPDINDTIQDGDEDFKRLTIGDLTLTPIFVNALLHWGPPRADFYAGLGVGMVLAEIEESDRYREFVGDFDGVDDVTAGDTLGLNLKLGSNIRLSAAARWYLYFEAQFYTTQALGNDQQLTWPGVSGFFGTQDFPAQDRFGVPADYRLVDPGSLRVDGAIVGVGFKYQFGGKKQAARAAEEAAAE